MANDPPSPSLAPAQPSNLSTPDHALTESDDTNMKIRDLTEGITKALALATAAAATTAECQPNCTGEIYNCLASANVPFLRNTDATWDDYAYAYNVRLPFQPLVVVLPATPAQVADAVVCAGHHGLPVQAKSGGHSYASFSNGGADGAVMVHLQNLRGVEVDGATGIAKVGGGVRLGPLSLAVHGKETDEISDRDKSTLRALAHGTCPAVGIGGHYTHGGFGHFSRAWGLALDQIVAMDVVLANGTIVYASREQHQDIFFAMRGAADMIGIAVNFYLQTQPAPKRVVSWTLDLPSAAPSRSVGNAVGAFLTLQDLAHDAEIVDRRLSFGVTLGADRFHIAGTYLGSLEEFNTKVGPALRHVRSTTLNHPQSPIDDEQAADDPDPDLIAKEVSWLEALRVLSESGKLTVPEPHLDRSNFYAKSVTVKEPGLSETCVGSYFQYMADQGKSAEFADLGWYVIMNLYGGADSQINTDERRDPKYAAYRSRNLAWVALHQVYVPNDEPFPRKGITFLNGLSAALTYYMPNVAAYVNYVDSEYDKNTARDMYYGEELYAKLKRIKREVDSDNVFANPHSIDP